MTGKVILPAKPLTTRGSERVQSDVPEGSRLDVCSPNWCDRTTWFAESLRVNDATLTDIGDSTTFNSAHANWIDVSHGKITNECVLAPGYMPIVRVDGITKTENAPESNDGDFSIDYTNGRVVFNEAVTGQVTASYSYENGSKWSITPDAGKTIRLTHVEVQFSENVVLNDSVFFRVWAMDPQVIVGYTCYKTMRDYINAASGSYPVIPVIGGANWRALQTPIHIFRWPYSDRGSTDLKSSQNMKLTIELEDNNAFGGAHCVATVYGISESEGE